MLATTSTLANTHHVASTAKPRRDLTESSKTSSESSLMKSSQLYCLSFQLDWSPTNHLVRSRAIHLTRTCQLTQYSSAATLDCCNYNAVAQVSLCLMVTSWRKGQSNIPAWKHMETHRLPDMRQIFFVPNMRVWVICYASKHLATISALLVKPGRGAGFDVMYL